MLRLEEITPPHLQAHFYFLQSHNANSEKNKKELASHRTATVQTSLVDSVFGLETVVLRGKRRTTANKKINANFLSLMR